MNRLSLPTFSVTASVAKLADTVSAEVQGAVFTRPEVVEFILDLAGYTADRPLHHMRLLEPACGEGEFLLSAVDRLFAAQRRFVPDGNPAVELVDAIRAVELGKVTFAAARARLHEHLKRRHALTTAQANVLAAHWLVQGDFLLTEFGQDGFDVVVGNPPYVRQELIPNALLAEYRTRYTTLFDRADLYVPFIERSLALLRPAGALAFICSDRWTKNRYGGPLRQMVSRNYHLRHYVDMVDTPAFQADVIAYPAIFIIAKEAVGPTTVAHRPAIDAGVLTDLARQLTGATACVPGVVTQVDGVAVGADPWVLEDFERLALVRRLEASFPAIEDAGCRVGIGVATGADKAFIGPFEALDVEDDRKLPLVMTTDIDTGQVEWRGRGVINPFRDDGKLVDLRRYPRLAAYLERHRDVIRRRNVAQRNPVNWYRTIDRITPALAKQPKLLIPDIKGAAHVVYEDGTLYPHHNLYFVTSDEWNLMALRAVLLSGIARLFVGIYSTKMRGGYLRFQAQYLRRIRIPRWTRISPAMRSALVKAAASDDLDACNAVVADLYRLTNSERRILGMPPVSEDKH